MKTLQILILACIIAFAHSADQTYTMGGASVVSNLSATTDILTFQCSSNAFDLEEVGTEMAAISTATNLAGIIYDLSSCTSVTAGSQTTYVAGSFPVGLSNCTTLTISGVYATITQAQLDSIFEDGVYDDVPIVNISITLEGATELDSLTLTNFNTCFAHLATNASGTGTLNLNAAVSGEIRIVEANYAQVSTFIDLFASVSLKLNFNANCGTITGFPDYACWGDSLTVTPSALSSDPTKYNCAAGNTWTITGEDVDGTTATPLATTGSYTVTWVLTIDSETNSDLIEASTGTDSLIATVDASSLDGSETVTLQYTIQNVSYSEVYATDTITLTGISDTCSAVTTDDSSSQIILFNALVIALIGLVL